MVTKTKKAEVFENSLVNAQVRLSNATTEYKKSKDVYAAASDRLQKAEDEHQAAVLAFNQEVMTVKESAVVKPIGL